MEEPSKEQNSEPEAGSLEDQTTVVDPQAGAATEVKTDSPEGSKNDKPAKPTRKRSLREKLLHQNIYLLLFVMLVLFSIVLSVAVYLQSKQGKVDNKGLTSQSLSPDSLKQLANSDVTVGDPKQVLTVQSNAIFAGQALIRGDLEVAGKLKVGSSLSLKGITVSGQSVFDELQITKNLSVAGNAAIQGQLTAQSLAVTGSGTFGGTITAGNVATNSLTLNGTLRLTHHIVAGGATPSRSNGSALGGGGTASVSGSDSAGSVNINTGSSPPAGCFITVNFRTVYNSTPRVVISPVGSEAGKLQYYVNRTTSNFSICTASAPAGGKSLGFDYIIFE